MDSRKFSCQRSSSSILEYKVNSTSLQGESSDGKDFDLDGNSSYSILQLNHLTHEKSVIDYLHLNTTSAQVEWKHISLSHRPLPLTGKEDFIVRRIQSERKRFQNLTFSSLDSDEMKELFNIETNTNKEHLIGKMNVLRLSSVKNWKHTSSVGLQIISCSIYTRLYLNSKISFFYQFAPNVFVPRAISDARKLKKSV